MWEVLLLVVACVPKACHGWEAPASRAAGRRMRRPFTCSQAGPHPPPCHARLRAGQKDVLIATDVASKGLDFEGIQHVINYDMPEEIENYVHRIGRTGKRGWKHVDGLKLGRHAGWVGGWRVGGWGGRPRCCLHGRPNGMDVSRAEPDTAAGSAGCRCRSPVPAAPAVLPTARP